MNYDELERLKVEADRWIACVAGDGSTAANASQGIRSLFDKLNISLPEAARVDALQAQIDRLMLEYCPNEMTPEQVENWKRHQSRAPQPRS